MVYYKKVERNKPLVVVATIGTLIAPQIVKLHCKDKGEALVCLSDVEDLPHQAQVSYGDTPSWEVTDHSAVTASGNASVSPSPYPPPPPVS